jgi:hypothetical protein
MDDEGVNHYQLATGQLLVLTTEKGGLQYRRRNDWPLNKYYGRDLITQLQYRAGNKLYRLYVTSSHVHTPVQMRYDDFGEVLANYERKFEINQEYMEAIMAIATAKQRLAVQRVCLDGLPAGRRRGMVYLREGLDSLVKHFRLYDGA